MEIGVIILTVGAFGLAIYQGVRERTALYVVALLAGQLSTLPSPFWQWLYRFSYGISGPALLKLVDHPLPRIVALAGWTALLPPLLIIALSHRRAWFTSYPMALLLFTLFLMYQIVIEVVGTQAGWWRYEGPLLPLRISGIILAALMNALVSLGVLAALQVTRHYALGSLLLFLLPVPLLLRLLVHGLLGAPIFTVLLIRTYMPELATESWADLIGVAGTLALLGWGVHVVAGTLARQGDHVTT
ncbi:MAG: hypothetical protein SH847_07340 [Roseiflexaceae bacterium]|nr:hypothetical protein [Roseiflexaceae bacterium]